MDVYFELNPTPSLKRMVVLFSFLLLGWLSPASAIAAAHVVDLREVLSQIDKTDPNLGAANAQTRQAEHSVDIAKSAYYPKLDLQAVDSGGFPGSSRLLELGGLVSSPFRSGPAYGLVANMTLYDFGRTSHGVGAAEEDVAVRREDYGVRRIALYDEGINAFFDCVRYRTQAERYHQLSDEAKNVVEQVSDFVRTGQKSVVDRYLAQTQKEQIDTEYAGFEEQYLGSVSDLNLLTGTPHENNSCPPLYAVEETQILALPKDEKNPITARAEAARAEAREQAAQAKADFLPKFLAVGSVGEMSVARLVDKEDYAVGVGIIIPIFEGFKTKSDVARANARIMETDYGVSAAQQRLDELNIQYDKVIRADRAKLKILDHTLELSRQAFVLAKKRYLRFEGELIDVREALRNLMQIEGNSIDIRSDMLRNTSLKVVVNGGHP